MSSFPDNLQINSAKTFLLCLMLGLFSGCATTKSPSGSQEATNKADPYENINRKIYRFNDSVDDYVAKPITDTYKFITPDFMETGVSNFFNNLKTINVVLNDALQAKFEQSGRDTGRFLMNSTLGLGGLFDVAKTVGFEQNDEDFEQTLAVWGVPRGSYLVLPLLGPITTRGISGAVFDAAANPASYIGAPIQVISLLNARANAEGALKFIDEASLDPYVFTRESFLQWRTHLATDGKTDASSDLMDIDAELLEDDQANGKKTDAKNGMLIKQPLSSGIVPNTKANAAPALDASKNKNTLQLLPPESLDNHNKSTDNALNIQESTKKEVTAPLKN
ncbi:MAG: VacJ family lipoprotein [Methyloglobulus sp.]|nr:VacJ family lipoprotein [Methyloglobulus sp.]